MPSLRNKSLCSSDRTTYVLPFRREPTLTQAHTQYAPAQVADRIDYWVVGTLAKAGLQADIIHFSSCLWDVMHWSEVDSAAAGSTDVVHAPFASSDRLDWYRERLTSALDKVEHTFPTSTLVWRRGASSQTWQRIGASS